MKNIAIWASGTGSNALKIIEHFKNQTDICFYLLCNKPQALVLEKIKPYQIESLVFDKADLYENNKVLGFLQEKKITLNVLAGFLWLMPNHIIEVFPKRILNIHPALLPKFGGKGMYGMKIHEAVRAANETETGITIHYTNEQYDEGEVIFQAKCAVEPDDTLEQIAQKVQKLEHTHFPLVVEQVINFLKV